MRRGRGGPAREWTGPPSTLKNSEEPFREKPTLRGNVLPYDTSTASSFASLSWSRRTRTNPEGLHHSSVCPSTLPACRSTDLRADHGPTPTGPAAPPTILRSLGVTWSGGGPLSHEHIRGQKDNAGYVTLPGSESAVPVRPLRPRYSIPLVLFPLKNIPESASETSTVGFDTTSTAPTSHSTEILKTAQVNEPNN